jgi:hypothetical protein
MVAAACIKCGSLKRGALSRCPDCFFLPRTEDDLVESLALSDRHYDVERLKEIGAAIADGQAMPAIAVDHADRLRRSARGYHAAYGDVIDRIEAVAPAADEPPVAGAPAMRDRFTDAEWELVSTLPLQVFGFVAGADGTIDRAEINDLIDQIAIWQHLKSRLHGEILQSYADEADFWRLLQHANSYADSLDKAREIKAILKLRLRDDEYREFMSSLFWSGLEFAQSSGGGPFGILDTVSRAERKNLEVFADLYDVGIGERRLDPR